MIGRAIASAAVAAALITLPAGASGGHGAPFAPYDGTNPFNCALQQVGQGTDFPDPGADPFCVEYDKTNQDITGLGIVAFLSNEPARTAIAGGKCFYFQHDHWTGSVEQGGKIETYHWDGSYFFDRARGSGAVYVENVRALGSGGDPGYVAFIPEPFRDYFRPTGGGAVADMQFDPDPTCAAKVDTPAKAAAVYRVAAPPAAPARAPILACLPAGGRVHGRELGPVALGRTRRAVQDRIGAVRLEPTRAEARCLPGGRELLVGYGRPAGGHGLRVGLVATTSGHFHLRGVSVRSPAARARARLRPAGRAPRAGAVRLELTRIVHGRRLLVGILHGRVSYVGMLDPHLVSTRAAAKMLRGLG